MPKSSLRHLARGWRKSPGFTLSLVLTLALATATAVPVLGVVRAGRARTAPYLDPALRGTERLPDWLPAWTEKARLVPQVQDTGFRTLLSILLVLTALLLASGVVNVLTLILSRAAVRRPEIALRSVLGAPRRRLTAQLLGEAATVVVPGIVLGMPGGMLGARLLGGSWPGGAAPWSGGLVDPRILGAVAGGLAGVALWAWASPVRVAWKLDLRRCLDSGGRATATKGEVLLRNALAVTQLAASLVLLTVGGVLYHGFARGPEARELGFDPRGAMTARVELPAGYAAERRMQYWEDTLRRVSAVPGVRAAGVATTGAWVGLGTTDEVVSICPECIEGGLSKPVSTGAARVNSVSPGFFRALGVAVARGRDFRAEDRAGAPPVAVINAAFAHRLFPAGEALGKSIQVAGHGPELYRAFTGAASVVDPSANGEWYRVVGIVDDARGGGIGVATDPEPAVYLSALQRPPAAAGLVVRTRGDPMALAPVIERAVRAVDPRAAWSGAAAMEAYLADFGAPLRWFAGVIAALAAVVLVLAGSGLYGVMAYNVERRTREIGIRMALGARPGRVVRMVVGQGLKLTLLGAMLGLIAVASLARLLQQMLFGVRLWDPLLFAALATLLAAVAAAASHRPARRAASVDPQVALRSD